MTFYIVVKAKKDGRLIDETILEFKGSPHQKKIESEISLTQASMKHYLNLKGLEFSYQYASSEQQAKNSRLWGIAGRGNYIVIGHFGKISDQYKRKLISKGFVGIGTERFSKEEPPRCEKKIYNITGDIGSHKPKEMKEPEEIIKMSASEWNKHLRVKSAQTHKPLKKRELSWL